MLLLFSFLWLSSVSLLYASSDVFQPEDRVLGGHDIEIDEAPWQVSLQYEGSHICGGSIFNETIIITAAHCVSGYKIEELSIRAGSSKHNSGGILIEVAAFKYHKGYNKADNDVAVIKLMKPLAFNKCIQSIPLAKSDPDTGTKALTSGWGTSYFGKPINLQGLDLNIRDKSFCKLREGGREGDICAGFPGKAICYGDSGGPLVVNGKLVGIVSRTGGVWCLGTGLYASVAHYREWILKAIKTLR